MENYGLTVWRSFSSWGASRPANIHTVSLPRKYGDFREGLLSADWPGVRSHCCLLLARNLSCPCWRAWQPDVSPFHLPRSDAAARASRTWPKFSATKNLTASFSIIRWRRNLLAYCQNWLPTPFVS